MKRKILKFQPNYDFKLLGIVCPWSAIKFAREIKIITSFDIVAKEYYEIYNEKSPETQKFIFFESTENDEILSLFLLGNKSDMGYLIEEYKNIDFFIIIKGEEKNELASKIKKELKSYSDINAVFDLDIEKISSKQKLLL